MPAKVVAGWKIVESGRLGRSDRLAAAQRSTYLCPSARSPRPWASMSVGIGPSSTKSGADRQARAGRPAVPAVKWESAAFDAE